MQKTRRPMCRLNRREQRLLEDWLQANWEPLVTTNRMTAPQLVPLAAKAIGTEITTRVIYGATKVLGLEFPVTRQRGAKVPMEAVLESLRALSKAMLELGSQFGQGTFKPDTLRALDEIAIQGHVHTPEPDDNGDR